MTRPQIQRAIVTGANGHIGANVVRALIARGVEVVAFVRPGSDRRGLEGLDVRLAEGDILEADSLPAAMEGCDALFHCAAVFAIWATKSKGMPNATETRLRSYLWISDSFLDCDL